MNAQNQTNKPVKTQKNDNPVEQLRGMGQSVVKDVANLAGDIAQDALSSLLGTPPKNHNQGTMQPGQPVDLGAPPPAQNFDSRPSRFPGMPEYPGMPGARREVRQPGIAQETINRLRAQEGQIMQQIEAVRQELRLLVAALKNVDQSIVNAVDGQMVDPGEYHLAFLERIKTVLKLIRQNLQSSSSWLNVMKTRKRQKGFWAQYKKKGTEWGLNNERSVATQVG